MTAHPTQLDDRLAVSPAEAARLLGVSRSTLYESILGELRVVNVGRRVLVPVRELERWLERNAARNARGTTYRKELP